MKRVITISMIEDFRTILEKEEKSKATIEKYVRDIKKLMDYSNGQEIDKNLMISFKEKLLEVDNYKISSINSFLISVNRFLSYLQWDDAKVKTYKVQRDAFYPEDKYLSKEEYKRLIKVARSKGKPRLVMLLNTICATGIRISELQFITVENVKKGQAMIHCKGKTRNILIPSKLQKELQLYVIQMNIKEGPVFCSIKGNPLDRSNIWREMKALCEEAAVDETKVFPHNLRHLFAISFYHVEKDIAKLADVLGHSSIETTRIYIRTTSEEHRKQLELLDLIY